MVEVREKTVRELFGKENKFKLINSTMKLLKVLNGFKTKAKNVEERDSMRIQNTKLSDFVVFVK